MARFIKNHSSSTLRDLQDRANQFFENLFSGRNADGEDSNASMLVLRMDVLETGESYRVRAELPGVDQKGIMINVEDKRLTIRGQCYGTPQEGSRDRVRAEPSEGYFYRSVALPVRVNPAKVKAVLKSGILIIDLPKAERKGGGDLVRN